MSCQSQTENPISHPSITTGQSKQIHSSNQISVASTDQITNQPSPEGTASCIENPPECRKNQLSDTNSLPVNFKNSDSSLNIRLIDNIPQTLRPKNLTQMKKRIKEFSSEQKQHQILLPSSKSWGSHPHRNRKGCRNIR